MPYRYEAYDQRGQRVGGVVAVESEEEAEQFLWQSDLTIVSLKKAGKPFLLHEQLPSLFGVRNKDIIDFANQLAFLVEAGINVYTALQVIRDQASKPAVRAVLSEVVEDVVRGTPLSEACSRHPVSFPVLFVRMLKIGEETGRADIALRRVAAYMERRQSATEKLRSSLTYPAFVVVTGIIALYILLTSALPNLAGLFKEFGAQMPLPTRILVAAAGFMGAWGQIIGLAIAFLLLGVLVYSRTQDGKRRADQILTAAPVIGPLVVKLNLARITDTMGSLIAGGIPVVETLDLLVDTSHNTVVQKILTQVRADVINGLSLSQATGRHTLFPPVLVSLLRVGEEAGTVSETLDNLGRLYSNEVDRTINGLVALLEPSLTIAVGLAVGFISITVISTVYTILPQIK